MENPEPNTQTWQVETGGQVYDASLNEMQAWIADGALLRIDRVRKGNLRWIEAGRVPQLVEFFNAKDAGAPTQPILTTTHVEQLGVPTGSCAVNIATNVTSENYAGSFVPSFEPPATAGGSDRCSMHPDVEAAWACDTCVNSFCKACPSGYGATVKICPFCGAMCRSLSASAVQQRIQRENTRVYSSEGFGFGDFGNALAYPFRFKFSLVVGAIMFAAFSVGSGAGGFGGMFALVGGIICFMCSNMLSFGVLANTVENFSQGKLDENFMPSFDDFSMWDDVVHPFFLSIGVYISSFGPFLAVVLVAVFMVVGAVKNDMNGFQDDAARAVNPELPYAAKAVDQSKQLKELVNRTKESQQQRVDAINNGEDPSSEAYRRVTEENPGISDYDALNKVIAEQRKAQLESVVGKTAETREKEQQAFFKQILGYGALFLLLGAVTLLWGLFYFPAACAVAGYTRSFAATLNPSVGFDTIKRLGVTYVLILVMGLILLVASSVVTGVLNIALFAFTLPGLGNVPAKFFASLFGFYISVVFSCVLGYALFKKADQLDLPS